jgi:hypothetical protein
VAARVDDADSIFVVRVPRESARSRRGHRIDAGQRKRMKGDSVAHGSCYIYIYDAARGA